MIRPRRRRPFGARRDALSREVQPGPRIMRTEVCAFSDHVPGLRFPKRMRLARRREFDAVYRADVRVAAGPLVVRALPNELGHPRLGLAVGRRTGKAAARNRVRRLIRESFRLLQHDLPPYDLVIAVRGHGPRSRQQCAEALRAAVSGLERRWAKRRESDGPATP